MKKTIIILGITALIACGCGQISNKQATTEGNNTDTSVNNDETVETSQMDFKSLIAKVPITEIPIGINGLDKLDSLKFDYDNPNQMEQIVSYDSVNQFNLNDFFKFDDIKFINGDDILLHSILRTKKMFFAKRLPKIGDKEVLIYYATRSRSEMPDYPNWILIIVDENSIVSKSYILAGIDWKENDFITKFLFAIDNNYNLTIKDFRRIDDEESEDEELRDPNYLYPIKVFEYKLR